MPEDTGLYIHIPFCAKKCRYCDFYSACVSERVYGQYLDALLREIKKWGGKTDRPVSTVYIGGGTPSLLGEDILPLICAVKENFCVLPHAEITVECNPNAKENFYVLARQAGVNRLSLGVQTSDGGRLKALGRTHTAADAARAVRAARAAGFDNVSLDMMIALPGSNCQTVLDDADFILSLHPEHISAYILKIEPNTAFARCKDELDLPDEDGVAEQYLTLCGRLEAAGYGHYEISNFAVAGKESRHNLKYWRCEEYLGIGPSAHSFISGRRFYYPRDIRAFIAGNEPVFDGAGGGREERIMLSLRTGDGAALSELSAASQKRTKRLAESGLAVLRNGRIALTNEGMLVSNSIITELLYEDL